MTAQEIAQQRGGYHAGGGSYMIRCPAQGHDDRHPSCAIRDGERGLLVTCHSRGCDRVEILRALGARPNGADPERLKRARGVLRKTETDRREAALRIWDEGRAV